MKDFRPTIYSLVLIAVIVSFGLWNHSMKPMTVSFPLKIQGLAYAQDDKASVEASSSSTSQKKVVEDSPTPAYTSEQEQIISYIKQVFGKDADDAIKIAQCESHLNPLAVGHNTDGSIDRGLWQINDRYQGITNTAFLFDYKLNTLLAKKIFDGRGGNFSAWTCESKYRVLE